MTFTADIEYQRYESIPYAHTLCESECVRMVDFMTGIEEFAFAMIFMKCKSKLARLDR